MFMFPYSKTRKEAVMGRYLNTAEAYLEIGHLAKKLLQRTHSFTKTRLWMKHQYKRALPLPNLALAVAFCRSSPGVQLRAQVEEWEPDQIRDHIQRNRDPSPEELAELAIKLGLDQEPGEGALLIQHACGWDPGHARILIVQTAHNVDTGAI